MARVIEGNLVTTNAKFGIVVSRFNSFITSQLLSGAVDTLIRHGASEDHITIVHVPGSYEIPLAAQRLAASGTVDAIIALGAVIRGATTHYDLVAGEVAKGVSRVSLDHNLPVIFGVITTENIEQAIERSGTKAGNKGAEAAVAAVEMLNVLGEIDALKGAKSRNKDVKVSAV